MLQSQMIGSSSRRRRKDTKCATLSRSMEELCCGAMFEH